MVNEFKFIMGSYGAGIDPANTDPNTISEMNIQIKINILTDYKYLALSPNKSFIFSFKDKDFYELNGYYRLIKAKHFFTREGAGENPKK